MCRFLSKLKIKLPYDLSIPLLGIFPDKALIQKDMGIPVFIAALFTKAKTWKPHKWQSTEEWMRKIWYIYTHGM